MQNEMRNLLTRWAIWQHLSNTDKGTVFAASQKQTAQHKGKRDHQGEHNAVFDHVKQRRVRQRVIFNAFSEYDLCGSEKSEIIHVNPTPFYVWFLIAC